MLECNYRPQHYNRGQGLGWSCRNSAGQGEASSIEAAIILVSMETLKPLQREAIRALVWRKGMHFLDSLDSANLDLLLLAFDYLRRKEGSISL